MSLQNIIIVIKSRKMNFVGRVAHMGEMTIVYKMTVRKPEVKSIWKTKT
jgi:hypothetical protein